MAQEGRLKVIEGFVRDKAIVLPTDRPFVIGRDHDCTMPVMSRRVSRRHAQISFRNGVYAIADTQSKTGTMVNDRKVTSSVLRHNDMIRIGDVKMRFLMEDATKFAQANGDASKPLLTPPQPLPPPPIEETAPSSLQPAKAESSMELPRPAFSKEELARVGQTVGDIRLIAALDKGRRTVLYKGVQPSQNRVVTVKFLRSEVAGDAHIVGWFVGGAQRSVALRHEDVIVPLGGGCVGETKYIFTRFMDDSAQRRFVNTPRDGLLAAKRALESLVHVVRALEFAESRQVHHLGIRPSKILFDENRHAKLNGLGFDNSPSAPGAETTLDVEPYLAPEQTGAADKAPGHATDIFSLGATFYYMLTGRRPVRDARRRIPSPKLINRDAPASLCRIVEKMVVVEPERRYPNYGHLLHDLRWALRGEAWPHGTAH